MTIYHHNFLPPPPGVRALCQKIQPNYLIRPPYLATSPPTTVIMKYLSLVWVTLLLAITVSTSGHHEPGHDGPVTEETGSRTRTAMESAEIVPDVVGKAPSQLIKVSLLSTYAVNSGDLAQKIPQ